MSEKVYKSIMELGLAAVLIFAPLAGGATRLWAIVPLELVVLMLVFLWFWRMNNKTGWYFKPTELDLLIWIFATLAFISCLLSIYLHDSLYATIWLLTILGIYYLAVNNLDIFAIRRLIIIVVFLGTGMSLIGLAQYFFNLPHQWWADERFLTSTYVNHNHFAGYLEMVLPLTCGLFLSEKSFWRKAALGSAAGIMFVAFIFAQSRGAWGSLSIAALIMAFYLSKKNIVKKRVFLIAILFPLLIFAAFYYGEGRIAARVETIADVDTDASLLSRLKIWQGALAMIKEHPLAGTGIGTLVWGFSHYRPSGLNYKIIHAHNDYLHMAAEMGMLSLLLMFWMVFIVLRRGFSLVSKQPICAGITVGLLSIFLHGFIDFNFHIPANMTLVAILCAFLMSDGTSRASARGTLI